MSLGTAEVPAPASLSCHHAKKDNTGSVAVQYVQLDLGSAALPGVKTNEPWPCRVPASMSPFDYAQVDNASNVTVVQ